MIQFSDDEDDIAYKPDHETGTAPDRESVLEGGQGKPIPADHHTKWCVRECERSTVVDVGESLQCHDFSSALYNMPSRHGVAHIHHGTGRLLTADEPLGTRMVEGRP